MNRKRVLALLGVLVLPLGLMAATSPTPESAGEKIVVKAFTDTEVTTMIATLEQGLDPAVIEAKSAGAKQLASGVRRYITQLQRTEDLTEEAGKKLADYLTRLESSIGAASQVSTALRSFSGAGIISRGLKNNRRLSEGQIGMIVDALQGLKERFPDQADAFDREIFKVEHLAIGREAPNIKGVDTDNVEFELKDYRGKVVVLDFWGDW